jgi:hypothetical protein
MVSAISRPIQPDRGWWARRAIRPTRQVRPLREDGVGESTNDIAEYAGVTPGQYTRESSSRAPLCFVSTSGSIPRPNLRTIKHMVVDANCPAACRGNVSHGDSVTQTPILQWYSAPTCRCTVTNPLFHPRKDHGCAVEVTPKIHADTVVHQIRSTQLGLLLHQFSIN